jgi:PRC-barrel domain
MTITTKQLRAIAESGGDVRTTSGDKIGSLGQIYVDLSTGEPRWVTVRTGLLSMFLARLPPNTASLRGGGNRRRTHG